MQQAAQIKDHDLLSKEMADDDYTHQYETITSASRISMLLRPLMEKHAIITATLPDSNQFYNTALLSIDAQNGIVIIDELHPQKGNAQFQKAGRVTLHTSLDGVNINFTINLKSIGQENGMIFYALEFPKSLRYLQRRNAFRVPVSAAKDIKVDIQTSDNQSFTGELSDISAEGMCIRFPRKKNLVLEDYREISQCCIHLPDRRTIRCSFIVCHSNFHETSDSLHIGGQFENIDKIQRRAIERFVVELQRQSRKSLAR